MTPQQPPRSTGDPDLLALAAAIAADHRPGLHPIDLIVAARYGFTNDLEAHAILDAPHLYSRLTRVTGTAIPTGAIIQIAQSGDAIGEAHLKLLERTGHTLMSVAALSTLLPQAQPVCSRSLPTTTQGRPVCGR